MNTSELPLGLSPWSDYTATERLKKGIWPRPWALWFLVMYLAMIIIRPWEQLVPELGLIHFERLIVIGMVVVLLARGKLPVSLNIQSAAFLCLNLVVAASAVIAYDPTLSTPVVIEIFGMFLFYLFVLCLVRSPYQAIFIVACYIVILGVYQGKCNWEYFVNGGGRYRMGVRRLQGIELSYGHPNTMAFTIISALPFWYFLYRIRDQFTQHWPTFWRKNYHRFLLIFPILSVGSVLLTRSRAGALGLVFFGMVLSMRGASRSKQIQRALLVCVMCVVGFFVLPSDMRARIQSTWDASVEKKYDQKGANKSAEGRWEGFLAGMEMFQASPLLGVGIGNFKEYRVAECDDKTYLSAHNLPGELLGELGLLGGVAFAFVIWTFFYFWKKTSRIAKRSSNATVQMMNELCLTCRDSVLILGFASLSQHSLQRYQWFLIGALSVLAWRFSKQAVSEELHDDVEVSADQEAVVMA